MNYRPYTSVLARAIAGAVVPAAAAITMYSLVAIDLGKMMTSFMSQISSQRSPKSCKRLSRWIGRLMASHILRNG